MQVESLDSISEVDMVGTAPGWLQGGGPIAEVMGASGVQVVAAKAER